MAPICKITKINIYNLFNKCYRPVKKICEFVKTTSARPQPSPFKFCQFTILTLKGCPCLRLLLHYSLSTSSCSAPWPEPEWPVLERLSIQHTNITQFSIGRRISDLAILVTVQRIKGYPRLPANCVPIIAEMAIAGAYLYLAGLARSSPPNKKRPWRL